MQFIDYRLFEPTNCTINNKLSFVTYVRSTCFDLYKVIIREAQYDDVEFSGEASPLCWQIIVYVYKLENIYSNTTQLMVIIRIEI